MVGRIHVFVSSMIYGCYKMLHGHLVFMFQLIDLIFILEKYFQILYI